MKRTPLLALGVVGALLLVGAPAWAIAATGTTTAGGLSGAAILAATPPAGCLGDLRNVHQSASASQSVRQRTGVSFEDALLAIDWATTVGGYVSPLDVFDTSASVAANRNIAQNAHLNRQNVVSGLALGGGVCGAGGLVGGYGAGGYGAGGPYGTTLLGNGFVSPLDIGNMNTRARGFATMSNNVDLNPNVILAGIAMYGAGVGTLSLGDLANRNTNTRVSQSLDHNIFIPTSDALFALALAA